MKKLVLAITLFCRFAMAGYAFAAKEEECYNECNRCENIYKMRRFWKDKHDKTFRDVVEYCRKALNFCLSIGRDCSFAREVLNENQDL